MPLTQPVFAATAAAALPYLLSTAWLYHRYTYVMSPREKEVVWAGFFAREPPGRYYFWIWTLTALLSALGFVGSWLAMVRSGDVPDAKQYVFALIIALQTLFNLTVGTHTSVPPPDNRIRTRGRRARAHALVAWMALLLWSANAAYVWLWKIVWDLALASETWRWVLHFLNACLIFHGVWWDALFWWYTWARELSSEAQCASRMTLADHALSEDGAITIQTISARPAFFPLLFAKSKKKLSIIFTGP